MVSADGQSSIRHTVVPCSTIKADAVTRVGVDAFVYIDMDGSCHECIGKPFVLKLVRSPKFTAMLAEMLRTSERVRKGHSVITIHG